MRCWPRRSAIRNPSRLTRNLSRSATCSPIPSAKGGLGTRDPRQNGRPKSKAFVHLLAVSGTRTETLHTRRRGDRIAKLAVGSSLPNRNVRLDGEFRRESGLVLLTISFVDFDPSQKWRISRPRLPDTTEKIRANPVSTGAKLLQWCLQDEFRI